MTQSFGLSASARAALLSRLSRRGAGLEPDAPAEGPGRDLGTLPGYDSGVARDVNDRGFVVGENFNAATPKRRQAVVWNPVTHEVRALPTPAGHGSAAYAINHYGVIAGRVEVPPTDPTDSARDFQVAIWNACAPLTLLPDTYGTASGITRRERLVGTSELGGVSWIKAGPCT